MQQFLSWVRFLSTSKHFFWAKLWAGICALLLAAMSLFASRGDWGWVASLLFIFCIAVSSGFEALAAAFEEAAIASLYPADFLSQAATAQERAGPQSGTAAAEGEPKLQSVPAVLQQSRPQEELTAEAKLALCQYYAFLYGVVRCKMVGEGTWVRFGMTATKYRLWLAALSEPELRIVDTSKGRTMVIEADLRAAMHRISSYKQDPTYWEFPLKVYANLDNWKDHGTYKVNGEEAPLLLPLYPKSLQDLNLGSN